MFRLDEGDRGRATPRRNHRGVLARTDGRGDELDHLHHARLSADRAERQDRRSDPCLRKNGAVDLFDELDTTRPRDRQIGASSP
jgi:hypothetical protein